MFVQGPVSPSDENRLVITVTMNDGIPVSAQSYKFPSDLTVRISLDTHSEVSYANAFNNTAWGGTIVNPAGVREDVGFVITFDADGNPEVATRGLAGESDGLLGTHVFVGLRDDPFIRAPRTGRNIGAIVLSIPLRRIVHPMNPTLIGWVNSNSATGHHDFSGQPLRSMFANFACFNTKSRPADQLACNTPPQDVMIFNTEAAALSPNGRALADDVVDLACAQRNECRVFNMAGEGASGPSANDRPYLSYFPYLATPHNASDDGITLPGAEFPDDAAAAGQDP